MPDTWEHLGSDADWDVSDPLLWWSSDLVPAAGDQIINIIEAEG